MIEYKYIKDIADEHLRPLYQSVGWVAYTNKFEDLTPLLLNSSMVISAWDDDRLIGLVRTVGDGFYIAYMQDLLVHPDYQCKGVGTALMEKILEANKDMRQFITITDGQPENQYAIDFYKRFGLKSFDETETCGLWRLGTMPQS